MSYVELEEVKLNDFAKVEYVANSAKTIISDGTKTKAVAYSSLGYESSGISVTISCDNATSVSISDGTTTRTKSGSSASFKVQYGTYTVSATNGTNTVSEQLVVDTAMDYTITLSFVHIYGIRRDQNSSSPEWTRTDEAVGKTVVASVGNTTIGHSDFDDCYPWSDMKRYNLNVNNHNWNDVMVYIPEFWYRRVLDNDGIETIQIADKSKTGFEKHPGSGVYVGAYDAILESTNTLPFKTISGFPRSPYYRLALGRGYIRDSHGNSWGQIDIATWSAIQMLYLVEFANNNSQSMLGMGLSNNGSNVNTGGCDSMQYQTGRADGTDGYTPVIYRGIEDVFCGNYVLDGINLNNGTDIYVCKDPSKYECQTNVNYTKLSYTYGGNSSSPRYITKLGYDPDNSWCMLCSSAGGSQTTYYCDAVGYESNTWTVPVATNDYNGGYWGGIFGTWFLHDDAIRQTEFGRMVYYPSLDTNNSTTITGEWTYGG